MSKMSELSLLIDELKVCGQTLISVSESMKELFSSEKETVNENTPEQTPPEPEKKSISMVDVRTVMAEKSRKGYTSDVKALLTKHGVGKLSEIKPEDYEVLLKEAEVIGNA